MTNLPNGKSGPLDGVLVLDWTIAQFGPVSTMMLADMGAQVIKVESLDGDSGRQVERVGGYDSGLPDDISAFFESLNRQKLGIALDLKKPRGVEIMCELVKRSDVLVQNFRQGVAERLGLGYNELVKHNPQIIYASASGYGPEGPDASRPAYDLTGEARSGALWWTGGADDDTPIGLHLADQIGGIMLSYGVLGALIARERFGFGQKVDVSHLGSMIWGRGMQNGISLLINRELYGHDRRSATNVLWNFYKCRDGEWLAFAMGQQDRYWPIFCEAIECPELIEDGRFNTVEKRYENLEELVRLVDAVFAGKTRDEWETILARAGDLIYQRVQRTLDLPDDPQVVANNYIIDFEHPVLGPTKWLQTPIGYSRTPLSTRKMAPALGENTEELLIDLLGYTWEDIESLSADGVIL